MRLYGQVNPVGSCRAQSVYLTTLFLDRLSPLRGLQPVLVHIISPETDNCPSWISGRERMIVKNMSWSISWKECCRTRWESPVWRTSGWATKVGNSQSSVNPKSASHNNCRLLCLLLVTLKVIIANSVDPDQTAPLGAVWSGSTLFAYMQNVSLKSMQEDAADDISRQHFQMQIFLAL